jgi:hypothetical protein
MAESSAHNALRAIDIFSGGAPRGPVYFGSRARARARSGWRRKAPRAFKALVETLRCGINHQKFKNAQNLANGRRTQKPGERFWRRRA